MRKQCTYMYGGIQLPRQINIVKIIAIVIIDEAMVSSTKALNAGETEGVPTVQRRRFSEDQKTYRTRHGVVQTSQEVSFARHRPRRKFNGISVTRKYDDSDVHSAYRLNT